ncbi:gliding motility-associated C-terminal domain-containing protein [Aquimarina sp. 2201CG1-2-11]|uniref:gliding motility-associated C-terminal domain-containing protein n=1 Tax=Aquimarina discodermiae TaxID=3231043 RepID=UPI003461987F
MKYDTLLRFSRILMIFSLTAHSQFHIKGTLHIAEKGQLSFHTDLINNGDFDDNYGRTFFYHADRELTVSGNNKPVFYDMTVHVINDLYLEVPVGITRFKEFISGRIHTPRDIPTIYLGFKNDAPYLGETNTAHIDGYSSNKGLLDFTFPIGDEYMLRPMKIEAGGSLGKALGAYFSENPNIPSTFTHNFDTSKHDPSIAIISTYEFWDLNSTTETKVTLTWNTDSHIASMAGDLSHLRVVGWSIQEQKWVNLGNTSFSGDFTNGTLTSSSFLPDNYEVLTIGSVLKNGDNILVYAAMSPNGDGSNDTLIIRGIESDPNNEITIYNLWGVQVYHKKGYDNSWTGVSEGRATIPSKKDLPAGTYYYILKLSDQPNQAGYIYIHK